MRTNTKTKDPAVTHGGAASVTLKPIDELRRSVLANMLFEGQFYESGESVAERIKALIPKVPFDEVAQLAIDAREKFNLRHVPLLLVRELLRNHHGRKVGDLVHRVIQRPDELGELVALYWDENKDAPLPAQLKIGLARALKKFDEYQLAKWNKDGDVKLRDVLFLSHARPKNEAQAELFKRIVENKLVTPDTWEVELSAGKDKRATFERLIAEKKLGGLALLRNLRNMVEAKVPAGVIRGALAAGKFGRVLPFRFIAAAKYAPGLEDAIDDAMLRALGAATKLPGKTVVVIDVSGSMYGGMISAKSEMNRALGAAALGAICREICEVPAIYATGGNDYARTHATQLVPPRRGMALADAIYGMKDALGGGGIFLKQCMDFIRRAEGDAVRTIVITDEQDCDRGSMSAQHAAPIGNGYLINVASFANGIGYREKWTHITGFSEAVIDYIKAAENVSLQEVGQ